MNYNFCPHFCRRNFYPPLIVPKNNYSPKLFGKMFPLLKREPLADEYWLLPRYKSITYTRCHRIVEFHLFWKSQMLLTPLLVVKNLRTLKKLQTTLDLTHFQTGKKIVTLRDRTNPTILAPTHFKTCKKLFPP